MGKQKDNRYRAKVTVGHESDGKPIVKYASGKTKKELAANVEELKKKYVGGETAVDRAVTLEAFARDWYQAYKEPSLKASSKAMYHTVLDVHLFPAFKHRQLRSISGPDLQEWLNEHNSSKAMVNQLYVVAKQLFKAALAHGVIDRDPSLLLKKPTAPAGTKRALTEAETNAALHVIDTHEHRLMLALLYYTGARIGEVLGFQWGDIDFAAHTITVKRDMDYRAKSLDTVKTKASLRTIPLPDKLYEMLVNHPERSVGSMPLLHTAKSSGHLAQSTYKRWYESLMLAMYEYDPGIESKPATMSHIREHRREKRVKARGDIFVPQPEVRVSALTAHYFRHNYASILYNNGVDVLSAQRWLGHTDIKTTLQIYSHLGAQKEQQDTEKLRMAFQKLPKSCQETKTDI